MTFTDAVVEHASRPRNAAMPSCPTSVGVAGTPGEGPFMRVGVVIERGLVAQAGFETYGCVAAIACGSIATQTITGLTVQQASRLTAADIACLLGGLPEGKEHCAELAATALKRALEGAN